MKVFYAGEFIVEVIPTMGQEVLVRFMKTTDQGAVAVASPFSVEEWDILDKEVRGFFNAPHKN